MTVRPTTALERNLRLASRIEAWQRSILLSLAGCSQFDAHLSHAIVCHAENASIRTALIEACLRRADAEFGGGAESGEMPAFMDQLIAMGQSAPVPMVLESARVRQAFYRRLRMLAQRAKETRIARVCDEICRQEGEFVQSLRARLAIATDRDRITVRPRASSPFDALLARSASAFGSPFLADLETTPAPPAPNRPQ